MCAAEYVRSRCALDSIEYQVSHSCVSMVSIELVHKFQLSYLVSCFKIKLLIL